MASYSEVIRKAIKNDPENGELIRLLMLELCNSDNTNLYLKYNEEVDEEIYQKFVNGINRLKNNEPLQYILGYWYFCGYKMVVSPGCLIPRPETEELVGNILADSDYFFKSYESIDIADIGTGSGAIAIALKKEEDKFNMIATDISFEALEVARKNCEMNDCAIQLLQGDMLQPLIDRNIKLDILVSNPPYIPKNQKMEKSVIDYEPHVALFGGDDGLYFYRKIFENAHKVIKDKSFLAFEIGYDEKENVEQLVKKYFPNDNYQIIQDINNKDRMLFIYHNLEG